MNSIYLKNGLVVLTFLIVVAWFFPRPWDQVPLSPGSGDDALIQEFREFITSGAR